ncbi:MAG: hypothetical protein LBC41_15190 [Clostridiales bacterium]|nr:hypothetical protein [Clostridiales bacterium]MDR2751998.1 hypothetical protein [Clostridiales bacterium]
MPELLAHLNCIDEAKRSIGQINRKLDEACDDLRAITRSLNWDVSCKDEVDARLNQTLRNLEKFSRVCRSHSAFLIKARQDYEDAEKKNMDALNAFKKSLFSGGPSISISPVNVLPAVWEVFKQCKLTIAENSYDRLITALSGASLPILGSIASAMSSNGPVGNIKFDLEDGYTTASWLSGDEIPGIGARLRISGNSLNTVQRLPSTIDSSVSNFASYLKEGETSIKLLDDVIIDREICLQNVGLETSAVAAKAVGTAVAPSSATGNADEILGLAAELEKDAAWDIGTNLFDMESLATKATKSVGSSIASGAGACSSLFEDTWESLF